MLRTFGTKREKPTAIHKTLDNCRLFFCGLGWGGVRLSQFGPSATN
jgi:hypothetical protein